MNSKTHTSPSQNHFNHHIFLIFFSCLPFSLNLQHTKHSLLCSAQIHSFPLGRVHNRRLSTELSPSTRHRLLLSTGASADLCRQASNFSSAAFRSGAFLIQAAVATLLLGPRPSSTSSDLLLLCSAARSDLQLHRCGSPSRRGQHRSSVQPPALLQSGLAASLAVLLSPSPPFSISTGAPPRRAPPRRPSPPAGSHQQRPAPSAPSPSVTAARSRPSASGSAPHSRPPALLLCHPS